MLTLDDPAPFRAWLASLPPDTDVRGTDDEVLLERYLRTADPEACLCGEDGDRESDDWQCHCIHSRVYELNGWSFFWLPEMDRCTTPGEALVSLEDYCAELEAEDLAEWISSEPWRWRSLVHLPRNWRDTQAAERSLARGVAWAAGAGC